MAISPAWNDESLCVGSDTKWRARYRALQSWYRETVLTVSPGKKGNRIVGSMLPSDAKPGSNFLTREIADYVDARLPVVQAAGGTIEEDRLRRNMLSSMPLAFNLFGFLRGHLGDAAPVLSVLLKLDIASVVQMEVEEAPPRGEHLGDRTAFDAFVEYRTGKGERAFLGIEVKYTEPFSTEKYERDEYKVLTEDPRNGFRPGATTRLKGSATNQLWRNTLLVLSLRTKGGYAQGHSVVLACRGDEGAAEALTGLRADLLDPDAVLRGVALEDLVAGFRRHASTTAWSREFERRYLDLTPVS